MARPWPEGKDDQMLTRILLKARKAARRARSLLWHQDPVTAVSRESWLQKAQEGEFQFHVRDKWRPSDDFARQSRLLFEHFGLPRDRFENKTVVDLGAGSKLRSKYFSKSRLIAIEPLAERFLREIPWCDLKEAAEVYPVPAEQRIEGLVGRADLLVSINVLDHCYDFETIIENIREYLHPEGLAFLSFDKHKWADEMHPLELTEETCAEIFARKGLQIQKASTGFGRVLGTTQTYGHGPYCMNNWLTKR